MLAVRLLGAFEVTTPSGAELRFSTRKTALIFAYLALHLGAPQLRSTIAGLFWSNRAEEQTRGSLRQALFAMRRTLEEAACPILVATKETLCLDATRCQVDVLQASRLASSDAIADLRALKALYRGGLLETLGAVDPAFDEWLGTERMHRERQTLDAFRRLLGLEMAAGEHAAALATAERICELDPLCEASHRTAMRCHALRGDRSSALRTFERLRQALERELGVEPEPETATVVAQIRRPPLLTALRRGDAAVSHAKRPQAEDEQGVANATRSIPALGSGAAMAGEPAIERRHVAILAVALANPGSTDDPEAELALGRQFFGAAEPAITALGGFIDRRRGLSLVAVFGAPVAFGNDCERALRAACALKAALMSSPDSIRTMRAAIAHGSLFIERLEDRQGTPGLSGPALETAERLSLRAGAGDILLCPASRDSLGAIVEAEAVSEAASDRMAGQDRPTSWRLVRFRQGPSAVFVGRAAELAQLEAVLGYCRDSRRGRIIHIRGEPGIGKTRLAEEIRRRAIACGFASHTALVLDFGGHTRREPLRTLARSLVGLAEADNSPMALTDLAAHVAKGLSDPAAACLYDLLDAPAPPALRALLDAMDLETRAARSHQVVNELVEGCAAQQPLFLLVEDLHWVDPASLKGLAQIAAAAGAHAVVITLTSRTEGDPLTAAWRASAQNAPLTTIDLGPMARSEAAALADALGMKDADVVARCIERAGGNPLFLEQLLRLSAQHAPESNVPASVQSIVQVRLDELAPEPRALIQAATVLGQRFSAAALGRLADDGAVEVDPLIGHGMIRPDGRDFIFAHALLRDAIYATLLPSRKRALHRKAAAWFEGRDAILHAEHLEQAGDNRATDAFRRAAEEQLESYRYQRAQSLAERGLAVARTPEDRAALTLLQATICHDLGDMPGARSAYAKALALAPEALGRCRALLGQAAVKRVADDLDGALADVAEAERLAMDMPQDGPVLAEQARAQFMRGNLLFPRGNYQRCLEAHQASLALARQADRTDLEAMALGGIGDAQYLAGRMKSAYETLSACIAICQERGYGRIEVANYTQLGCAVSHFWPQRDALAVLEAGEAAAASVEHKRAVINACAGQLWVLRELGEFERCVGLALAARKKIHHLGALRYDQIALMMLGIALIRLGERREGVARLQDAVAVAERTGRGFHGAEASAYLAHFADSAASACSSLDRTEQILAEGTVGHSPLRAYPVAAAAAFKFGDLARAQRYLDRLQRFTRSEPLALSSFHIDYLRAAVRARSSPDAQRDGAIKQKLAATAKSLHLGEAIALLESAFDLSL